MALTKHKMVKNASWIIVSKILQSVIALVIGTISARYLGPSNYGLISYAASVVAFVVPLAQLGLRNILVEQIVSNPEREGEIMGTSLVMSVTASLFCVVGCITFTLVVNAGERDTVIVCALYSTALIFQMLELMEYWYQAKLLSKYTSILSFSAYTIVAIYKTVLLITEKSIYWFALSNALDYLLLSAGLLALYPRFNGQKLSFSFLAAKELFAKSRYYILSGMMVTIFSQTDKVMLKMMVGNAENGYYATAATCAAVCGFIFLAIIDTMRPVIFDHKKSNQAHYEKNLSRLFSVIIWLGLCQSVAFTLLAKPMVLILYGSAYAPSVPILRVLTWGSIFSYMGTVRNIWMLAEGKQKYLWMMNLAGAVLNMVGNFLLIPIYGAVGAAIASVVTQCFTNCILCFLIKPIHPVTRLIGNALHPKAVVEVITGGKH